MKLKSVCPHCHASIKAPESYAGRSIACPRCGRQFAVGPEQQSSRPPAPPSGPIQFASSTVPSAPTAVPRALPASGSAQPGSPPNTAAANTARGSSIASRSGRRALTLAVLVVVAPTAVLALAYMAGRAGSRQTIAVDDSAEAGQPSQQDRSAGTAQKPVVPDPKQAGSAPAPGDPAAVDAAREREKPETLTPNALFKRVSPAVAWIEVRSNAGQSLCLGTGFFVDRKGSLVTNCHVALAEGAAFLVVKLPDETTYFADEILAFDPKNDLAVVKVKASGAPSLELCRKLPEIGETVFAIGNPSGLQNTISEGLVSGLRGSELIWAVGAICREATATPR